MTQIWSDLKYGIRMMTKAKAFTMVAVLTLAVGIGANTAIFSVIYGVLLRPLAFNDADRLVHVWHTPPQASFPGMKTFAVSPANYLDWKAQNHSFQGMAVGEFSMLNLTGAGDPVALRGWAVSTDYFSVLGVSPLLGRTFAADEDQDGRQHVVVLSYALWNSHFAADKNVVGRTVSLNEVPYTVVGVLPKDVEYPEGSEYWVPVSWTPAERIVRGAHDCIVIARLKSGVDIKSAQAEMVTISRRLEQAYPVDNNGWGATIVPLKEDWVGDVRPALLVLFGAVFFVLLIACANVANLMLAKILDRRTEIAVRTALGATRGRILSQVLVEAVVLSVCGGLGGVLLAKAGVDGIVHYLSAQLPRVSAITVDWRVLAFTMLVSIAAGVATGFIPAWRLSGLNVSESLKHGGRGPEIGSKRTRHVLVVAEVALSLMLLAGAGLLLRTLWKLQSVDPGFDPHSVAVARISVPMKKFTEPGQAARYYEQIQQQLRGLPGAESVALADSLPLRGGSIQPIQIEGRPVAAMADQPEVPVRRVTSDYFKTMRIRILRGREFTDADTSERPRVAVISEGMAKRFWPNDDPLGKHVSLTFASGGPREIVGITDDIKLQSLSENEGSPVLYIPVSQMDAPAATFGEFRVPPLALIVRTATTPASVLSSITTTVHQVDAGAPVSNAGTMEELLGNSLAPQRFNMFLLGTFAIVALLLAMIGIYSVLAYSVRRRTAEIGIRIALGARITDVVRLVLREGMTMVLIGIAGGLAGSLLVSRFLSSMVYGVRTTDLPTFSAVALLLVLVALVAAYLPARRATRIDPLVALRDE